MKCGIFETHWHKLAKIYKDDDEITSKSGRFKLRMQPLMSN
jgi:hypothetical protein